MLFLVQEKHKLDVNAKAQYDTCPLHVACSRGNKAAVGVLIEHKDIKLDLLDANNDSILHEACTANNVDLLNLLMLKLADKHKLDDLLRWKNDTGHTPLHAACAYGQPKMAQRLLMYPTAKPHRHDKNPPLLLACCHDKEEVVCEFLKIEDMELFSKQRDGASVLHLVAERGWSDAANMVISNTSARQLVHARDRYNRTPLHYAATKDGSEIIKLLVEK